MLLGVLAAVVVVCGTIGFEQLAPSGTVLDSLYRALQLFVFGGASGDHPNGWLEVARFTAPFVVGYAAFGTIITLYREQLDLLRFRGRRNHVVIAGLGTAGFTMATAFDRDQWQVIVIDKDPNNPAIKGCRERGIGVLIGDASDQHILRKVGLRNAILLVVTCGQDAVNLDIAAVARTVVRARRREPLTAFTKVDDRELWHTMRAQALLDRDEPALRLEFFNEDALAAEVLLDAHPALGDDGSNPQVLVVGTNALACTLVLETVQRWVRSGRAQRDTLSVTLAGEDAPGLIQDIFRRYPQLADVPSCQVSAWKLDLPLEQLDQLPARFTAVYLVPSAETDALTLALDLRMYPQLDEHTSIVLAIANDDAGVGAAIDRAPPGFGRVTTFGFMTRSLTPEALTHTATERLAELTHALHREAELAAGADPSDPALSEWKDLSNSVRESNRLFADGIGEKLTRLGCTVAPAPLLDPSGPLFEFTAEEIDRLAPGEHERWEADMKRLGYRHGAVKDQARKLHPMIDVPYEQLPEHDKEKDREHVRIIPEILARAGLEVRRVSATGEHLRVSAGHVERALG